MGWMAELLIWIAGYLAAGFAISVALVAAGDPDMQDDEDAGLVILFWPLWLGFLASFIGRPAMAAGRWLRRRAGTRR